MSRCDKLLHKLWGKATEHPDYVKSEWLELQRHIEGGYAAPDVRVEPVSPGDVKPTLPDPIITVWNRLIEERWDGKQAIINQEEAISAICKEILLRADVGDDRSLIINRGWLDIEEVYRSRGWRVRYDKPGYSESYAATFTFTRRKQ